MNVSMDAQDFDTLTEIEEFYTTLDQGVARYVRILRENGVETYESCQGGEGHAYLEPTIRFHGQYGAGFQALQVAFDFALPVSSLRRAWQIIDGEPTGPHWEMVFWKKDDVEVTP